MSLIISLDSLSGRPLLSLVEKLCPLGVGFKIGWPNIIVDSVRIIEKIKSICSNSMVIADLKLADIGYTMDLIVNHINGADAIIAHAFLGKQGALDQLKEKLDKRQRKLILVISMSHPGSRDVMDPCLNKLINVAREVEPWGIVAPATRPWIISITRRELGRNIRILSPGIGAQGAAPGTAIRNGADYEIVGRYIVRSENPVRRAREILELHSKLFSQLGR